MVPDTVLNEHWAKRLVPFIDKFLHGISPGTREVLLRETRCTHGQFAILVYGDVAVIKLPYRLHYKVHFSRPISGSLTMREVLYAIDSLLLIKTLSFDRSKEFKSKWKAFSSTQTSRNEFCGEFLWFSDQDKWLFGANPERSTSVLPPTAISHLDRYTCCEQSHPLQTFTGSQPI